MARKPSDDTVVLSDDETRTLDAQLAALKIERAGYVVRELPDRIKAVDAEITRIRKLLGSQSRAVETATGDDASGPLETA